MWLERPSSPVSLDELLLDRLAIAAAAVVERYGPARTTMADPALVELVISADSDEAARARALRLLGFAAHLPVRVIAVRSQLPLDQVGILVCPARPVKAAPIADVGVILATTVDSARFPAGVRAGIGAAESPDRSWREARTASPPAPQQRRPPTRTARKDSGHRTHRAHRTDAGQARTHLMATPRRLRKNRLVTPPPVFQAGAHQTSGPRGRPVRRRWIRSWLGGSVPSGIPPLPATAAGLRQVDRPGPEGGGGVRIL